MPVSPYAQGQLVAGPSGASRYLYVASAGSSCVLAVVAQRAYLYLSGRVGEGMARWIGAAMLLLALGSSFIWLKRTDGISFYVSGRYYEASGDREVSVEQFELAIARGGFGVSPATFATKCLSAHYAIYDGRCSSDRVSTQL
ncbi:MAG: hypothetical protein ACI8PG_001885 [Planctomycetota bacterium]